MVFGASSKYLNSAGQSQPSIAGSSQRYQFPPNSERARLNARWKPGNGPVENSRRKPERESGIPWTRWSIISGTPDTNGSARRPRAGSSNIQVPWDQYG